MMVCWLAAFQVQLQMKTVIVYISLMMCVIYAEVSMHGTVYFAVTVTSYVCFCVTLLIFSFS